MAVGAILIQENRILLVKRNREPNKGEWAIPGGSVKASGDTPTVRKKIAEALERQSLDLRAVSHLFGIKEREALDHLQHIARSAHPRRLAMEPAHCNQCGFSFKKRTRLSTPGRCPLCKSESIYPPRFQIIEK